MSSTPQNGTEKFSFALHPDHKLIVVDESANLNFYCFDKVWDEDKNEYGLKVGEAMEKFSYGFDDPANLATFPCSQNISFLPSMHNLFLLF